VIRGSPTPFVVLSFPRTGSTWLMDMLNSHPEVAAYGELFNVEADELSYASTDMPYFENYLARLPEWTRRPRFLHGMAYLRRLYSDRPGIRAVGFKLLYGQAGANPRLLHLLALRRVRAVHLTRANLLDALISWKAAQATGVYAVRTEQAATRTRVTLNAERLGDRLREQDLAVSRARGRLERLRVPWIEVAYEELVGRKEESLLRILGFLDVHPDVGLLDSGIVRMSRGSSVDLVENLPEVRAALAGTRFEWMLEDAEAGPKSLRPPAPRASTVPAA